MKKHILGFAVFGFIFASFAVAFAIINAPAIPKENSVEVFSVPVYKAEQTSSCRKSAKKLSYEIISSQLDLDKRKLYTRVSLKWNGREPAPKNLYANVKIVPTSGYTMYDSTNIVSAFNLRNTTEILLETKVIGAFVPHLNIYAKYSFSEQFIDAKIDENYSESFPVLVSYGNSSESVKKGQLIVR